MGWSCKFDICAICRNRCTEDRLHQDRQGNWNSLFSHCNWGLNLNWLWKSNWLLYCILNLFHLQRTKWGLLCDGWNSGIRYYKNNFSDGFRTDGMHFFLGELTSKDVTNGIVSDKVRQTYLHFYILFKKIKTVFLDISLLTANVT